MVMRKVFSSREKKFNIASILSLNCMGYSYWILWRGSIIKPHSSLGLKIISNHPKYQSGPTFG